MAARALAVRAGSEAAGTFVRGTFVQPLVAIEWEAWQRTACREGSPHSSEIRTSVPIRRAKMSKFPTRISAARRNAEALLSRSKKQESTLKLEQEREHDAMVEKTARLRALRLAKEASDREAAASAPPSARPKSRRAAQK
jgi:hypothetical protein